MRMSQQDLPNKSGRVIIKSELRVEKFRFRPISHGIHSTLSCDFTVLSVSVFAVTT